MSNEKKIGMVHGRFQPFHIGHLEYISIALKRCDFLVVGITNPEPSEFVEEVTSSHRHLPHSNPFSFFQRAEMIKQSLIDLGFDISKISFTPFHLFSPEKWQYYLPNPSVTTQFIRIFSDWERKKADLFLKHGFQVEILDEEASKLAEGIRIRMLMDANARWDHLVPSGTKKIIDLISFGRL